MQWQYYGKKRYRKVVGIGTIHQKAEEGNVLCKSYVHFCLFALQ